MAFADAVAPKTVLVLGASVSQLTAIRRAHELGFRVVALDGDVDAVGFGLADVSEAVDFSNIAAAIEVARRHRVDGVVAISTDRAVPVAAAIAEALGLPGIGVDVALAMTDKGTMRDRIALAGLPQPPYALLGPGDNLAEALETVGTPAVVKPVDSGGQRGLFLIGSADELREAVPIAFDFSRVGRVILERYLPGNELNVMVVVAEGQPHVLTLSDRLRPAGIGFGVGWAHLYPSALDHTVLARAEEIACASVMALGLTDGIAFPQLLATDNDVFVVEVAARIAAGQMADLVRLGTGIDLLEVAFSQALGRRIDPRSLRQKFRRPLAIRFLTASPGPLPVGRLRSITGLDEVRNAPGVLEADLYLQPGETIRPVQVDADRRGYVIATGADPLEALARADEATRMLRVKTDER
jgi:biotin carboxylase